MSDGFIIKRGGGGGNSNASFKALVDKSITEVTADMLDGVTSIGKYAFSNCNSLASIEIPNSVTSIGEYAFYYCSNLTSITIPNSVLYIWKYVFSDCRSLASIEIPSSIVHMAVCIFDNCTNLTNLTIKATNPPTLVNSDLGQISQNLVIYVPASSVDAYKAASGWSTYADKIQAIPSD